MLAPSGTNEPLDSTAPADLVEVGVYRTAAEAAEHGLVVLALGRPYWLAESDDGHRLLIEPEYANDIRRQLASYDRERIGWPPKPVEAGLIPQRFVSTTPLLWALVVLTSFWTEVWRPDWVRLGALDAERVFGHHEWWRPVTALFLHADVPHLLSNGIAGIFVFTAVLTTFGRGRGWRVLALSAVLGNIAAVAAHFGSAYRSLGASTAVFAGVGLLTGRAVRRLGTLPPSHRWRAMFVPAAAGFTVVALYGAGGVHVDVLAHLTGFMAGAIVGALR